MRPNGPLLCNNSKCTVPRDKSAHACACCVNAASCWVTLSICATGQTDGWTPDRPFMLSETNTMQWQWIIATQCHLCRVAGNTLCYHNYSMWVPVAVRPFAIPCELLYSVHLFTYFTELWTRFVDKVPNLHSSLCALTTLPNMMICLVFTAQIQSAYLSHATSRYWWTAGALALNPNLNSNHPKCIQLFCVPYP